MSVPTPQEIHSALRQVEDVLKETGTQITSRAIANPDTLAYLCSAKAQVLNATALTLLVEAQQQANEIAAAQVYATMGEANYGLARKIVEEARSHG